METENRKHYPTLKQSWFLTLIAALVAPLVVNVIISIPKSILVAKKIDDQNILQLLSYILSMGIVIFLAFKLKLKAGDKPLLHYKNKVNIFIYIILIPATFFLGMTIDSIGEIILPEMPDFFKKLFESAIRQNAASILSIVIAAPIMEEIICRGIICEGLIKNTTPQKAILWSAFIFAAIHLNPWQGLSAFVIGCFLGYIYWKTRSIVPCIFIHFINNGIAMLTYFWIQNNNISMDTSFAEIYKTNNFVIIPIGIIGFGACFAALWYLLKNKKQLQN